MIPKSLTVRAQGRARGDPHVRRTLIRVVVCASRNGDVATLHDI